MMKSLSSTTNHNVRPRGMLRKPSRTRPGKLFAISRKAAIGKPYRRMPPGHTDCTTMVTPVKDNEKIVKNIPQGKIPIKNSDCLLKPPFPSNIHGTDLQKYRTHATKPVSRASY